MKSSIDLICLTQKDQETRLRSIETTGCEPHKRAKELSVRKLALIFAAIAATPAAIDLVVRLLRS